MLRHKLFSCNMLSSYVIERVCLGRVAALHAAPSGTRSVLNASLIPPAGELREAEQILEAPRGLVSDPVSGRELSGSRGCRARYPGDDSESVAPARTSPRRSG